MNCSKCKKPAFVTFEAGECKVCFDKKPKAVVWTPPKKYTGKKKVCPECRTRFMPNVHQQRYCKTECTMKASNRARRKREEPDMAGLKVIFCKRPECGKMFTQKHPNERLCSPECREDHKKAGAKALRAIKREERTHEEGC